MAGYDELVAQIRERVRHDLVPLRQDGGGQEVQLSVRLPEGLRSSVAAVAARRRQSVSAFVKSLLEQAVVEASDPFAGLGADLAANSRALLAEAVESGRYGRAAKAIDRVEQRSATS